MGSDSNPMMGNVTTGQNISLSVNTAVLLDKFGIIWMVSYVGPQA
jgi:hypothetical protein